VKTTTTDEMYDAETEARPRC